ncbi:thiol:disulfide interchange protein [Aquimarina sp. TRL1]|uniref:protein-disulfide reductase DsbD family protein n=1 Tax=Aquimarina sp. (strain TRL1) TaxID=2736252 RepID=UPI00158CE718|nr:thioredoxin family protein [Aquimarina sp. TRL1]QKX07386.1 thiol:disulfide interchange protein [Aquimarina sp. TRL1]
MRFLLLLTFVFISHLGIGQIHDPVIWNAAVEKENDSIYSLVFSGDIEREWHVYSQQGYPEDAIAPIPLSFVYPKEEGFTRIGKASESKTKTSYNEVFELDETYFEIEAILTQKIKVTDKNLRYIKAEIEYQVCKEVCINENRYFLFDLVALKGRVIKAAEYESSEIKEEAPKEIKTSSLPFSSNQGTGAEKDKVETTEKSSKKGLWSIFFIAFFSGFAALLTPCVFPMIPMTVSFFTKQSKNRAVGIRNALLYGLFIIVIYVALGSVVTGIFGADALNALSTNVWFNLIFFALLVIFAISFLGAFEIMLPNSWANKVDRQADRGGMVGIFFMALALAIVSFSCTGPIVGTLLVESASKGGVAPIMGMLGFSLAIALPFALFALFPGWLNSLPKSGGWLNTVKVFLGFLELAFAFKFLSNADLVLQLHWLEREVFLAIWIAIFGVLGLYLLGKIQLPHDSPIERISVGRLLLAILTLTFTIYLIPGLWGAPLKLISGFPPPLSYSESPYGVGSSKGSAVLSGVPLPEGAKYGEHDIITFTDYDKGLAYAKKVNKPVLIDFTGYACVNCRKMEENVWVQPKVLKLLSCDVVMISLYVDYKKELPKDEQYISETTGKKIKTIGNKWSDFQIRKYKANAQPYYVLTDLEENNLNDPIGYTSDAAVFLDWLENGIKKYPK